MLEAGCSAIDAVTETVCALEDEPLFNAGRGAVLTRDGRHEMDAAIMDGRDGAAGGVAGICGPRNPVRLARAVMEWTDHVLMMGEGALAIGHAAGLAFEADDYFSTPERLEALQETLRMEADGTLDDDASRRHGTVGAVARDRAGHLAAATSTGGMTGKRPGRIGDSPIIGAGTLADDRSCAISATGDGEIFLRHSVAREIEARVRLTGASLAEACEEVVLSGRVLSSNSGGLVAVDREGVIALPYNSAGMFRGHVREGDAPTTAIYSDELS